MLKIGRMNLLLELKPRGGGGAGGGNNHIQYECGCFFPLKAVDLRCGSPGDHAATGNSATALASSFLVQILVLIFDLLETSFYKVTQLAHSPQNAQEME